MLSILLLWLSTAVVLMLIAMLLPGIMVSGFLTALIAAVVMGLINISIRPALMLLTLPINFLTLGLFALVVNAAMFSLTAWFVPGFAVTSFWSALFGSILLALLVALIGSFTPRQV